MKVFVALPTYDRQSDSLQNIMLYAARMDNLNIVVKTKNLSALCWNFNELWCEVLNDKTFDYFILLHADICPRAPTRWIGKMVSEAERTHVDLFSVVSPLKSPTGLTSTAIGKDIYTYRRLSLTEIHKLPETFTGDDAVKLTGYQGELWVNTGLMLCDVRRNRDKWEQMYFKTIDRVEKRGNQFVSVFHPEDWDFSQQAHARGLKVAASRAVSLSHYGAQDYMNSEVWGTQTEDV